MTMMFASLLTLVAAAVGVSAGLRRRRAAAVAAVTVTPAAEPLRCPVCGAGHSDDRG
jgi:hypothetical protein